jgi:hypothetical protein
MIGYIHIRPGQHYDADAGLQGTPESKGGATIAYIKGQQTAEFAVARCSPKDSYSRSRGRLIANGRLQAGPGHTWNAPLWEGVSLPEAIITRARDLNLL